MKMTGTRIIYLFLIITVPWYYCIIRINHLILEEKTLVGGIVVSISGWHAGDQGSIPALVSTSILLNHNSLGEITH